MMSKKQARVAQRLLAKMAPEAAKLIAEGYNPQPAERSVISAAMLPYLNRDNMAGVNLYEAHGGYVADLVLKQTPAWMADSFGPKAGQSFSTVQAALNFVMVYVVAAMKTEPPSPEAEPGAHVIFNWLGFFITLPRDTYEDGVRRMEAAGTTPGEAATDARIRLAALETTLPRFDLVTDTDLLSLVNQVVGTAIFGGICRWPEDRR